MTRVRALCRDCLLEQEHDSAKARRCASCRSPRLLVHAELSDLSVAHIDCDAFYATVEKRDDESLRDKPLIIGGGKRGVVSTCCYIARTFGVRSAMPMFKALALCPNAIVLHPNMTKYAGVARQVRALMFELTPLVEPISIDEAFLDLSGTQALHRASPAKTLAGFTQKVEKDLGITVSVGLSYCKFLAKIGSDLEKPRGFSIIGRAEAKSFLSDKSLGLVSGVGKRMQERLATDGFTTFSDVQARDEAAMMRLYGVEGQRLFRLAQGNDARKVTPERDTKSISAETTFENDLSSMDDLAPILHRLCEKLALRLRQASLATSGITLKLKSADFKSKTRARSGFPPTQLSNRLYTAAREVLSKELDGTRFRLIGIAATDFHPASKADEGDLVDTKVVREKATEDAIDKLRSKFGADAVIKGIALPRGRTRQP